MNEERGEERKEIVVFCSRSRSRSRLAHTHQSHSLPLSRVVTSNHHHVCHCTLMVEGGGEDDRFHERGTEPCEEIDAAGLTGVRACACVATSHLSWRRQDLPGRRRQRHGSLHWYP